MLKYAFAALLVLSSVDAMAYPVDGLDFYDSDCSDGAEAESFEKKYGADAWSIVCKNGGYPFYPGTADQCASVDHKVKYAEINGVDDANSVWLLMCVAPSTVAKPESTSQPASGIATIGGIAVAYTVADNGWYTIGDIIPTYSMTATKTYTLTYETANKTAVSVADIKNDAAAKCQTLGTVDFNVEPIDLKFKYTLTSTVTEDLVDEGVVLLYARYSCKIAITESDK